MGKKKTSSGFGRTLIKDRFRGKKHQTSETYLHTTDLNDGYDWNRLNLQSVTEQNTLDEFLATAELAGTEFQAEKMNITVITPERHTGLLTADEEKRVKATQEEHRGLLSIPRRPSWDEKTSAEELDRMERDNFLEWRRELAQLQEVEGLILTPFERNLDFWRQLWRVIERSDIIVQIVDGRNPLMFRCEDLEVYVKEINKNKVNIVLINKADFLSQEQREYWAGYFDSLCVRVVFWSAADENARNLARAKEEQQQSEECENEAPGTSSEEEEDSDLDDLGKDNDTEKIHAPQKQMESDEEMDDPQTSSDDDLDSDDDEEEKINDPTSNNDSVGNEQGQGSETDKSTDQEKLEDKSVCKCNELNMASDPSEGDLHCAYCLSSQASTSTRDKTTDDNTSETMIKKVKFSDVLDSKVSSSQEGDNMMDSTQGADKSGGDGSVYVKNIPDVLTGDELLEFIPRLHTGKKFMDGITTIGLVGYPNVGKSSTINALLQTKKVPVSATPGRTKHFQTLYVDKTTMLCDCPGLVMPTFVSTKAEMIISGILAIDHMRDYVPPISLVCKLIPRSVLEATYGFMLPLPNVDEGEEPDRIPTAHETLTAYACMRGFMTHKGVPDFQRSARVMLKDYVNGKLLYCHTPPSVDEEEFKPVGNPQKVAKIMRNTLLEADKLISGAGYLSTVDREFFTKVAIKPGSKGVHGVVGFTRKDGFTGHHSSELQPQEVAAASSASTSSLHGSVSSLAGKPWKKHGNRGKKEKLRRMHKDLDVHSNYK